MLIKLICMPIIENDIEITSFPKHGSTKHAKTRYLLSELGSFTPVMLSPRSGSAMAHRERIIKFSV